MQTQLGKEGSGLTSCVSFLYILLRDILQLILTHPYCKARTILAYVLCSNSDLKKLHLKIKFTFCTLWHNNNNLVDGLALQLTIVE